MANEEIVTINNKENLDKLLAPMFQIMNEKNIIYGVRVLCENSKLYICFDKVGLSEFNKDILEKISVIYSETIFYSDNSISPNSDRLENWCPDENYDREFHKTERIRKKKMFVLELDLSDTHIILGTTIMLANVMQEQNPMELEINQGLSVIDQDIIEREKHYNAAGCPDKKWINLSVMLNRENPLCSNMYAPQAYSFQINSPVSSDSIILSTLTGYNEKKYYTFCMDKEELDKVIKEFFEKPVNVGDGCKKLTLDDMPKRLLG